MEDEVYTRIQTLITEGNIADAEHMLDGIEDKDARWYYLSSHGYLAKYWTNEARKRLEKAIELDAENEKYKEELERLIRQEKETLEKPDKKSKKKQLGNIFENCPDVWDECCIMCGLELCYTVICEGCSG